MIWFLKKSTLYQDLPYKRLLNKRSVGSPGSKVSILGTVGSPGTLAPELQASQAGFSQK